MSFDSPTPSYIECDYEGRPVFDTPSDLNPSRSRGIGLVDVPFPDAQLIDVDVYNQVKAVIPTVDAA